MRKTRVYLEGSLSYINFSILLFGFGIIFGWHFFYMIETNFEDLLQQVFSGIMVKEDFWATTFNIFKRNIFTSLILILSGILIIPPIIIIAGNGMLIGFVGKYLIGKGLTLKDIIKPLIPHGLFEIPALVIATGMGIHVGMSIIKPGGDSRIKNGLNSLKQALYIYITLIIPLLVIAAIVEMGVSKHLIPT